MKSKFNDYPLLTKEDILILRGQPVTKKIAPDCISGKIEQEEWGYYNRKMATKEYYLFSNGSLIGYKKE